MSKKSTPLKKSYIHPISHSLCIALFIGIITCLTTDCMGQKEFDHLTYETPGVLMASDVLPPELKWGKNYSVRGVTANNRRYKHTRLYPADLRLRQFTVTLRLFV